MQPSTLKPVRRHPLWGPTVWVLAGGFTAAGLAPFMSATPAAAAAIAVGASMGETWGAFADWLAASYARAPALVLGLAALIAVPPLALFGLMVRRRETASLAVAELQTQVRRPARTSAVEPREGVRTGHIPLRPLEAWIEVVGDGEETSANSARRHNLARTLLRIGRETDNDVCISDTTVHRYHAAIHRTEDAEFVITDLSSAGGNGVLVNGRAVAEARLANGDMIDLGNARLKFSAAPRV